MAHQAFQKHLLQWFADHGRDLPWRQTRDSYRIWISEIMLQQTQVDRVIDFYQRFLKKFPNVDMLSKARWPQVLSVWRGLGYYRRARNILRAAKVVSKEFDGTFPKTVEGLEALPGIGPYTARAIAVFAYEQDVLVLDTNTSRVLSRYLGLKGKDLLKRVAEEASHFVPKGKSWPFHQGLMDFGAMICTAKDPKCGECPIRVQCHYYKHTPSPLPSPPKRERVSEGRVRGKKHNIIEVAAGIIHRNGKILITRRPEGTHLAGFWEFPGGKRMGRESGRSCLKREMKEELGLEVAVRPHDWSAVYAYNDRTVKVHFHRCSILKGNPKSLENQEIRWIKPEELRSYPFPPANKKVITELSRARFVDPHK